MYFKPTPLFNINYAVVSLNLLRLFSLRKYSLGQFQVGSYYYRVGLRLLLMADILLNSKIEEAVI